MTIMGKGHDFVCNAPVMFSFTKVYIAYYFPPLRFPLSHLPLNMTTGPCTDDICCWKTLCQVWTIACWFFLNVIPILNWQLRLSNKGNISSYTKFKLTMHQFISDDCSSAVVAFLLCATFVYLSV